MSIIYGLDAIAKPFRNAVVSIGNFDGVHLGHQTLFRELIKQAVANRGKAVIVTFEPHPLAVLKPEMAPPIISPLRRKTELILSYGIDHVLVIPFTREFAAVRAADFVRSILYETLGMRRMIVGYDYCFGRDREGNIEMLRTMGKELRFNVEVLSAVHRGDTLVSSTMIRNLLKEGNVARVNELLARPFQLQGKIVEGRKIGAHLLGFPTANLDTANMGMIPARGVYAVEAILGNDSFAGVCNVGFNPTFGESVLTVEAHILDFHKNIYGENLRLNFIQRLRDEKKFSGVEALAGQIEKDARQARTILSSS